MKKIPRPNMKKVYKAHILFTKEKNRFEVFENGYIAVEDGIILGVSTNLADLDSEGAEVVDFGDRLLMDMFLNFHLCHLGFNSGLFLYCKPSASCGEQG